MTINVRDIFEHNIKLLGDMDKAVYYFREQEYEKALSMVADNIDQIRSVIEKIVSDKEYFNLVTTESVLEMLTGILEAKKNMDFILLADLLELQLINFLLSVQELIISKEEILFDEDHYRENISFLLEQGSGIPKELMDQIDTDELLESGYRIEFTSCGLMTLAAENEGKTFYFHTNNKIKEEAFLLAKNWYGEDKNRYVIYGFGLGYHVYELQALAEKAEIEVYESDPHVIQLACAFTDVKDLIDRNRVKIIFDPELVLLKMRIATLSKEETFYIHYPSYKNIRSREGREILSSVQPWSKVIEAY